MKAELLLKRRDLHGEGITWLEDGHRIAWVDILGKLLMTAAADGTDVKTYPQPTETCAVLPAANGQLVVVRRKEVVLFDEASGKTRLIWSADGLEPDSNRFNDAAVDPLGNLWIASMDFDAEAPTGTLWRVTPEGEATKAVTGYKCLNGPEFSPDGTVLYLGDTMKGQVLTFDVDPATGALKEQRLFIDLNPFGGLCDGMAVDSEGNLWLCQITAGRIGCHAPDGTKLRSVALPVPMVTSCCFGGTKFTDLYAITSRILLDDAELEAYPNSGAIFVIRTHAPGRPSRKFSLVSKDQ